MGAVGVDRPDVLVILVRVTLTVGREEELVDEVDVGLLLVGFRGEAGFGEIDVSGVIRIGSVTESAMRSPACETTGLETPCVMCVNCTTVPPASV